MKKDGDKVMLRILRRKFSPPPSSGIEDATECVQEQASKERAVVGAMTGLGGEMDVDVDGGSSDFDSDLDDEELNESSSDEGVDGDSSSSSFEDEDDDDEVEDDDEDVLFRIVCVKRPIVFLPFGF